MVNAGIVIALILLIVFLFASYKKSAEGCCGMKTEGCCGMKTEGCCGMKTEGCCGMKTEGFAMNLSPRGGYPNCKGCVIDPVSFGKKDGGNLWNNVQGMGLSPTMSGTVFRDWQSLHGNNMERNVQSNNLALEELKGEWWKNPYSYPAYAVDASSAMLPLQIKPGNMMEPSCSSCAPATTGESYYHLFGTMHGNL